MYDAPAHGWAGDEDEEYSSNPENHAVYALNTLCNYDPDVMRYLKSPAGSAFIRVSENSFELDDGEKGIYVCKRA